VRVRRLGELVEEARLSYSSFADDRDHLTMPSLSLSQGLVQGLDLCLPPHGGPARTTDPKSWHV
jgi:hypothetical protein